MSGAGHPRAVRGWPEPGQSGRDPAVLSETRTRGARCRGVAAGAQLAEGLGMVDGADGGPKVSDVAAAASAAAAAAGADDWRVVDRTLRGLARRRAALDVEEAAWLRRARALGVHREFGFATFFEYVERILGYAPGPARERLRVADALAALPKLRAAMSAGDVAYSAARELTRVATVDTEDAWLAAAAKHTVREIEDMVSGRRRGDSPDDPPDPAARLHELRLLLPAAVLGKFTAARRALEAACGHPLTDGDLLATLCDGQLAGAGSHVGDAAAGSHVGDAAAASRPMYQIAITRCPDCMRAWQDVAGHTIEISETELAQASCDAELARAGRRRQARAGDQDDPAADPARGAAAGSRALRRPGVPQRAVRRRPPHRAAGRGRQAHADQAGGDVLGAPQGRARWPPADRWDRARQAAGHARRRAAVRGAAAVPRGRWRSGGGAASCGR
ncbi:MAG: hypothetical protein IPH44_22235 [Myxococcales bacterium]|nr:hypothetical protein [Myxococcales bacterium]